MAAHQEAVSTISGRVRTFHKEKLPFRIYHGSTNSTRTLAFQRDRIIDTSKLTHVLEVNKARRTALVEPNVAMDQLVNATLPHGLVPRVVMEVRSSHPREE